ncbi:MAG: glutathione S-transferase family protein [Oligoflexales bacterium]
MEIYWISGSGPCWKVLLLCETQGINYQSKKLEVQNKEQKSPAFLSLNDRGKVPVINDKGFVLKESGAIMRYLDQKYLDDSLQGKSLEATAKINELCCEIQGTIEPSAQVLVRAMFRGQIAGQYNVLNENLELLYKELSRLESRLQYHDYLCSNKLSLADYHLAPTLMSLERAKTKEHAKVMEWPILPLEKHFKAVSRWLDSIKNLPSAENAYPPHWR